MTTTLVANEGLLLGDEMIWYRRVETDWKSMNLFNNIYRRIVKRDIDSPIYVGLHKGGKREWGIFHTNLYNVLMFWIFFIQILFMNGASSNLKTNAIASFYSLLLQYVIIFITFVNLCLKNTPKFQHLYILWSILISWPYNRCVPFNFCSCSFKPSFRFSLNPFVMRLYYLLAMIWHTIDSLMNTTNNGQNDGK